MVADDRRAHARVAARSLLAQGQNVDRLTLRMVAEEAGMPLPTLTYVYGSIGLLLADLRAEFEFQVAATQDCFGPGGLVAELDRMFEAYLDLLEDDPANIEILRYQVLLMGRGEIVIPGGLTMRGCLTRIQEKSGEQWLIPLEELSTLTQSMVSGGHMQFFVQGADQIALQAWRHDARLFVEALGRLALPERSGDAGALLQPAVDQRHHGRTLADG